MNVTAEFLAQLYSDRRQRYANRDRMGTRVRRILSNDLDVSFKNLVPPGQEPVLANLISAGYRLMGQRVGVMPRIEVTPQRRYIEAAKTRAQKHQDRLKDWADTMRLKIMLPHAAGWLVAHGLIPLVVKPNKKFGIPVIECRDPLSCLPGTVWPHMPDNYDVLFANKIPTYQAQALYPNIRVTTDSKSEAPMEVVIGEYYDESGCTVALLEPRAQILEFTPAVVPGEPMVFLARGFSPDLDFHGQFDSVVTALLAQAKVTALAIAYVEQMVFAETTIVGQDPEIISNNGQWAAGPMSVNVVRGASSAEKLTNNMSQQVGPLIDRLERDIRLGGTFPAQLSGEPTSSIATGKGTEALLTQVDDNTDYWRVVLGDALERALACVGRMAKVMGCEGSEDIADDTDIVISYHTMKDPAEVVQNLQLLGPGVISKAKVRRGYAGIENPDEEEAQVEVEELRSLLLQKLAEDPTWGAAQVAEFARARLEKGEPLEKVLERIQMEQMAAQAQAQGPPSLASMMPPGAPGAGPAPGPFQGGQPGVGPAGPPTAQPPVPLPA